MRATMAPLAGLDPPTGRRAGDQCSVAATTMPARLSFITWCRKSSPLKRPQAAHHQHVEKTVGRQERALLERSSFLACVNFFHRHFCGPAIDPIFCSPPLEDGVQQEVYPMQTFDTVLTLTAANDATSEPSIIAIKGIVALLARSQARRLAEGSLDTDRAGHFDPRRRRPRRLLCRDVDKLQSAADGGREHE